MTTYLVLGTSALSINQPVFRQLPSPPNFDFDATHVPTEAQLTEFITKLHGWQVDITATTYDGICTELRNKARNRIFGAGAPFPLSTGNPIADVYVNNSRESGEQDVWRDASGFAIHPVINKNYPAPGPIFIGAAPHPAQQNAQYWICADVVAQNL